MSFGAMFLAGPTLGKPVQTSITSDGERIIAHLKKHGEMTTKHIQQDLGIINHHLYKLEKAGLIKKEVRSSATAARSSWWRLNNGA